MKNWTRHRGVGAALMVGVMATTLVAPAAQAGHRRSAAGYRVETVPVYPRTVVHRSSSGAGPLIAGLIGGIVIGSVIANASNASIHASYSTGSGYSYWDPYCETRYVSLDRYQSHLRGCGHPHVVRVMQRDRYVRDLCWQRNGWSDFRGDWRAYGGGYGSYGSRGGDRAWQRDRGDWRTHDRGGRGDWRNDDRDRRGEWRGDDRWRDRDEYRGHDRGDDRDWRADDDDDARWRDRDGDRRWDDDDEDSDR